MCLMRSKYLCIVAMHVMTVVRERGSLAPLADNKPSYSSGVDAAAAAAKKSVDSGPSRTPSSLAYFGVAFAVWTRAREKQGIN